MGYDGQSWSTAMYLYAVDAVEKGAPFVFSVENGWYAPAYRAISTPG
jgi:hypothetical protein